MTVLFDSGVGLFDAAAGLFDDSGIVNASVTLTGAEVAASAGTVTSNGTRSETVSVTGAAVTMSLGDVTATSSTVAVKSGRTKRAGKFIPYVYNGYTPPPEVKHAHAICIGAEATATAATIGAVGTVHIDGRASCKSIKVTSAATPIRARGVINPTEEEWQLLLAA